MKIILSALLLLLTGHSLAIEPIEFRDAQEEQRFRQLANELRCVMCQNQSLADSNAGIAIDLRRELIVLLREGKTDDEIKQHLVARYSDFILYQPPVKPSTWLLWFGPLFILATGLIWIVRILKNNKAVAADLTADKDHEW